MSYLDQSLYYKSAKALTELNLSADQHSYPIGYQIFASPLVFLFDFKGYFYLTLATFATSLFFFYKILKEKIGFCITIITIFILISNKHLLIELITPWTNNLVFSFYNIFVFIFLFKSHKISLKVLPFFFLVILFTRPIDVLMLTPFYFYFSIKFLFKTHIYLKEILYLIFTSIFAILLFFTFNLFIYENLFSTYFQLGSSLSLSGKNFFIKLYSFIYDGSLFYNVDKKMFLHLFPWLIFLPLSLIFFIKHKIYKNIIVIISVTINFITYVSFLPVTPSTLYNFGTFRTFNLSIFYFSFFSILSIFLINKYKDKKLLIKYIIGLILLFISLNFKMFSINNTDILAQTNIYEIENKILINSNIDNTINKIELKGFDFNSINELYDHVRTLRIKTNQQCYRSQIDYTLTLKEQSLTINLYEKTKIENLQIIIDKKSLKKINPLIVDFSLSEICFLCNQNKEKKKNKLEIYKTEILNQDNANSDATLIVQINKKIDSIRNDKINYIENKNFKKFNLNCPRLDNYLVLEKNKSFEFVKKNTDLFNLSNIYKTINLEIK